jgi:dextranase
VLLADAVMFAAGASHIELGDGDRMLSNPYFPADTAITQTDELRHKLRSYGSYRRTSPASRSTSPAILC